MKRVRKDIQVCFLGGKKVLISVDPNDSVKSFMQALVDEYYCSFVYGWLTIDDSRFRIIRSEDYDKPIDDLNIISKVVYNMRIGGPPKGVLWSDYIAWTTMEPFQRGLPRKPGITIGFKCFSPFGEKRWTINPYLLTWFSRRSEPFQNHWTNYWDDNYDKNYKLNLSIFPFQMPPVLLIALKTIDNLEDIRYNMFGPANKSYYGGEYNSWQRYTDRAPFPVRFEEYSESHIKMSSLDNLDPHQWYAWVLLHTSIGGSGDGPAIYEDYIIPFLPNDCSKCREAILAFLIIMRRMGQYMYAVGKLVCREYLWKERFSE